MHINRFTALVLQEFYKLRWAICKSTFTMCDRFLGMWNTPHSYGTVRGSSAWRFFTLVILEFIGVLGKNRCPSTQHSSPPELAQNFMGLLSRILFGDPHPHTNPSPTTHRSKANMTRLDHLCIMHQTQLLSVLERNETNQQTVHVIVFEMHKRAEQSQNLT